MVPKLGVNLDFDNAGALPSRANGRPDPEELALFEWVRLVPRTSPGFADYVAALRAARHRVLLVLDKNALGTRRRGGPSARPGGPRRSRPTAGRSATSPTPHRSSGGSR